SSSLLFFCSMILPPPTSTLFPYTTLFRSNEVLTFDNEEQFFNHFNLHYIPPEVRENTNEIGVFKNEVELIKHEDIRGDLHMHTRSEEHTSELQSRFDLVCRLLLEQKKYKH